MGGGKFGKGPKKTGVAKRKKNLHHTTTRGGKKKGSSLKTAEQEVDLGKASPPAKNEPGKIRPE